MALPRRLHVLMRLRADHLAVPHPSRLAPSDERFAEIVARHARAVAAGEATYRDPSTGWSVFTAAFLAQRGDCCDTGCRHCPYVDGSDPG
jgi:hypothetical protein